MDATVPSMEDRMSGWVQILRAGFHIGMHRDPTLSELLMMARQPDIQTLIRQEYADGEEVVQRLVKTLQGCYLSVAKLEAKYNIPFSEFIAYLRRHPDVWAAAKAKHH